VCRRFDGHALVDLGETETAVRVTLDRGKLKAFRKVLPFMAGRDAFHIDE
jgi:hypothetical protein